MRGSLPHFALRDADTQYSGLARTNRRGSRLSSPASRAAEPAADALRVYPKIFLGTRFHPSGSALDFVELVLEFAQRNLQDLPDDFQIETEIVVDDPVAQTCDLSP